MKSIRFLFSLITAVLLPALAGSALAQVTGWDHALTTQVAAGIGFSFTMLNSMFHFMPSGLFTITVLPDVLWSDGQDNMGSLQTTIYYAKVTDFVAGTGLKPPYTQAAATTMTQLGSINGTHVFKSGKNWKRLYATEDTGMVESKQQGELDGKSFKNKISMFYPGARADALGWSRYMNNTGGIYLGLDAEGLMRQVGSAQWPAHLTVADSSTTATAAGRKGTTFEASCSAPYPAPIYGGVIAFEHSLS